MPEQHQTNRPMIDHRQPGYFYPCHIGAATAAFYRENGFLVLLDALAAAEVDELNAEAALICRGQRGALEGTGQPNAAVSSMDGLTDEAVLRQFLCIHQPHKCSPIVNRYLAQPHLVSVLTNVIGPNVKAMQSMLFIL